MLNVLNIYQSWDIPKVNVVVVTSTCQCCCPYARIRGNMRDYTARVHTYTWIIVVKLAIKMPSEF